MIFTMFKKLVQLIHLLIVLISISALLSNNQFIIRIAPLLIHIYYLNGLLYLVNAC